MNNIKDCRNLNQKIIFLFFGFILIIFSIYLVSMSIEYFI